MPLLLLAALIAFPHQTHIKLKLECGKCHAGNLPPRKEVCLECHQTVAMPPAPARLVKSFDHDLHLKMKSQCVSCHADVAEDRRAPLRVMAGCLVCHNKIDPPYSCEFCHARDMQLKPANHTPDFLDSHTNKKAVPDKTTCAVCHGRNFTCLGCH